MTLDGIWSRIRQLSSTVAILRLLLVLALVGPAAVLALVSYQSRTLLIGNATNRAVRMAELLAQHASATFDTYNVALSRIEEHLLHAEGQFQEQPLHAYLSEIDQDMKSVDGLVLIDANGMPLAHSRYFPAPKTYVGDRDYIRNLQEAPAKEAPGDGAADLKRPAQVRGREGLVVGAPIRSRYSGKIVLVVARARKDLTDRMNGALVVSISHSYFEDFYRTLALTPSDRVALVRADARVLVQIPPAPGRPMIDPEAPGRSAFVALASADPVVARRLSEGTVDYVSPVDEVRRISGLRKLDGYPVYVEVGFAVDAVLEPWRRQVLVNLAVAVLATLVLFAVARLALSKTRAEALMQERVLAEAHRRADAEAALRQAQKMEALGQLTGGIAHDFNNLLNIVLVNLELAAKRLSERPAKELAKGSAKESATGSAAGPDKLDGYIRGATQGAERGVALTRRLLAFACRTESAPAAVQVSALVFGLLDLLGQAAGAGVRITLDCPRGLRPARADANELETALLNLVVNARDAMPEGGRVHIAVREEGGGQAAKAGTGASEPFVVLSVKDTGRGMDAAMLARVTEPFFTTKEAGSGSGLGLAMVDRFASQSGGRLRLESRPGAGTTAEIWLPAAPAQEIAEIR